MFFHGYYTDVDSKLQVQPNQGKAFEVPLDDQSLRQGNTAVIRYNMVFDTASLGKFRDDNRTLRLIYVQGAGQVLRRGVEHDGHLQGWRAAQRSCCEFLLPKRGTIYDRNGQVLAEDGVTNYAVRLLTANGNPVSCYQALNAAVRLNVPEKRRSAMTLNVVSSMATPSAPSAKPTATNIRLNSRMLVAACNIGSKSHAFITAMVSLHKSSVMSAPIPADEADNYAGYPPGASVGLGGVERRYEKELAGDRAHSW